VIPTAVSRAAGRALGLPPVRAGRIAVRRDITVRARDGARLLTDHFAPDLPAAATILIRTPYGRGLGMRVLARMFAARGYHVVVQSCRGTYGSDGRFEPLLHERDDGLDTVEWLRRQPWYGGRFGMFGVSYQGFVQWALAPEVGDELAATVAVATASQTRDSTYAGESFSLDTVLTWAELLSAQKVPWWSRQVELKRGQPRLLAGLSHLPLAEADRVATGATVAFWQEWLREVDPDADYWRPRVFDTRVADVTAPVLLISGWHDIFLPAQLADYAALAAAGRSPSLRIGPWTHGSPGLLAAAMREGLRWFDAHLTPAPAPQDAAKVRVHVGGPGGGWRDLPAWPPPSRPVTWHLGAGGRLCPDPPDPSAPSRFRYDPADPTPSLGGPLLVGQRAGGYDNRPLEARADVLTFTSDPLEAELTLAGAAGATVYVRSEVPYFDVFVRLCEVEPDGRSENVCDGLVRVAPGRFPTDADGVVAVPVPLWPLARRFAAGRRLRVQVSGGAHPRYARNPGTGEPLGTAVELRAGGREVFHEPGRASAVRLPLADLPHF
jgi:uncharacterized protein